MERGGESNHSPIVLDIGGGVQRPPSPFKFNVAWVADLGYIELMKDIWCPLDHVGDVRAEVAFMANLKNLKQAMI